MARGQWKDNSKKHRQEVAKNNWEKRKKNKSSLPPRQDTVRRPRYYLSLPKDAVVLSPQEEKKLKESHLDDKELARRRKISETMKKIRNSTEGKQIWKDSGEKLTEAKSKYTQEKWDSIYKNPIRSKRISESRKKFLLENPDFKDTMIRTFMNAPRHRKLPNNPELNMNDLCISGLELTSDGKDLVYLDSGKWRKNPDFTAKIENNIYAVVEIMDFNRWHKREEIPILTKLYEDVGILCLVVDASRCYDEKGLQIVKSEVEEFLRKARATRQQS